MVKCILKVLCKSESRSASTRFSHRDWQATVEPVIDKRKPVLAASYPASWVRVYEVELTPDGEYNLFRELQDAYAKLTTLRSFNLTHK